MEPEIRPVTEKDLGQIGELERLCFSCPWSEAMLRTQLGEGHIFLAAAAGGRVLGYVGLMYVLDEGYISNVAVAPDCRRQGVASALMKRLGDEAAALDLSFMTLEVRAGNAPAIALYEKLGFRKAGLRKNYYERPREDGVLMTLELK